MPIKPKRGKVSTDEWLRNRSQAVETWKMENSERYMDYVQAYGWQRAQDWAMFQAQDKQ